MDLETIEKNYTKYGNDLDKELMNDIIIPFCIKWNLYFVSGMGTYVFMNHKETSIDGYDLDSKNGKSTFWNKFNDLSDMIWAVDDISKFLGGGYEYKGEKR